MSSHRPDRRQPAPAGHRGARRGVELARSTARGHPRTAATPQGHSGARSCTTYCERDRDCGRPKQAIDAGCFLTKKISARKRRGASSSPGHGRAQNQTTNITHPSAAAHAKIIADPSRGAVARNRGSGWHYEDRVARHTLVLHGRPRAGMSTDDQIEKRHRGLARRNSSNPATVRDTA